ncbi:MAG: hypothetical protein QG608_1357 [Actinomycetota bacterium]|nr:hypothetical protein [Actinomycetota bacterium]
MTASTTDPGAGLPGLPRTAAQPPVERPAWAISGWVALLWVLIATIPQVGAAVALSTGTWDSSAQITLGAVIITLVGLIQFSFVTGLHVISPMHTVVVQFFGRYIGTVRRTGLLFVMPFSTRRKVSVRVQNFETGKLKVNDADGNPVEFAAIVVWQVADTAHAVFAVEDYRDFIETQAESALRRVAVDHPYDTDDTNEEGRTSLRGSTDVVSQELAQEVSARTVVAGIKILEVRISHLAYAPEIAQAMLQRQQAGAIIAARSKIVDGAVGMVEMALDRLQSRGVVELDEERKAAMISNLLVVLCGEARTTPVVNTGTLYQ